MRLIVALIGGIASTGFASADCAALKVDLAQFASEQGAGASQKVLYAADAMRVVARFQGRHFSVIAGASDVRQKIQAAVLRGENIASGQWYKYTFAPRVADDTLAVESWELTAFRSGDVSFVDFYLSKTGDEQATLFYFSKTGADQIIDAFAGRIVHDTDCVSHSGNYEGRWDLENATWSIVPLAAP